MVSPQIERKENESYLETELTEFDDLLHTNASVLTFRSMVRLVIKTSDLKCSHIESGLCGPQIKKGPINHRNSVSRAKKAHKDR